MSKRAYRYRFYPTSEQAQNLACTFGCCRFVYNWALHMRTTSYFQHGIRLSHNDLSAALTALKKQEGYDMAERGVQCAGAASVTASRDGLYQMRRAGLAQIASAGNVRPVRVKARQAVASETGNSLS